MKYFAVSLVFVLLLIPAFSQNDKPEAAATSTPKPTPTPKKTSPSSKPKTAVNKTGTPQKGKATTSAKTTTSKPKTGTSQKGKATTSAKTTTSKPKTGTSKQTAKQKSPASKQTAGSKATGSGPKTSTARTGSTSKAGKPKTTATSKAAATKQTAVPKKRVPRADPVAEKAELDAAIAITDPAQHIDALRKFLDKFPNSEYRPAAQASLSTAEAAAGKTAFDAGDVTGGAATLKLAVNDAPKPIPDDLFNDLVKVPLTLFWSGERDNAVEMAKTLEDKCASNAKQLLALSGFYLGVESGSDAKRLVTASIALDPTSAAAYQTLGLANRMDFQLDDAAAAYAKSLELDPDSLDARRGLAEMKRATGKPGEAVDLYRQIIAKDPTNIPAHTGLALALFDAGKRSEAEAEMATDLDGQPRNVMLLAGAAYWYAAHAENQKAVDLALKAISVEPRYIWSYIALARAYTALRHPLDAERTLVAAQRYGNFPTINYEIASARAAAGFYREAAEELARTFTIKDGVITTALGGRVSTDAKDFTDLVSPERKASILTPDAADTVGNAAEMRDLLDLWTKLGDEKADDAALSSSVDAFTAGADRMKIHRELFAANELLKRKRDPSKVLDLTVAADLNTDQALDVSSPSAAVMADELYSSRHLASTRGEFIQVPDVPRLTLLAILRGRIDDMAGWALLQSDKTSDAIVRFKQAASNLPTNSSWWRSTNWRLGVAFEANGDQANALDAYMKGYERASPDPIKYATIEALYRQVNGSDDGLEQKVGPKPELVAPDNAVAQSATPEATPTPTPVADKMPADLPVAPTLPEATPSPTPATVSPEASPSPTPETVGAAASPTPEQPKTEATPSVVADVTPTPTPTPTPAAAASPGGDTAASNNAAAAKPVNEKPGTQISDLFPPVVIKIPPQPATAKTEKPADVSPSPTPTPTPAPDKTPDSSAETKPVEPGSADIPKPCSLSLSEESLTLENNAAELAVIVGTEDDRDLTGLSAVSSSPKDVEVRLEPISGIKGRALFAVKSISSSLGLYQITFSLPCGKKDLPVKVR